MRILGLLVSDCADGENLGACYRDGRSWGEYVAVFRVALMGMGPLGFSRGGRRNDEYGARFSGDS
jgi:hypothetical protein